MEDAEVLDDIFGRVDEEARHDGVPLAVLVARPVDLAKVARDEGEARALGQAGWVDVRQPDGAEEGRIRRVIGERVDVGVDDVRVDLLGSIEKVKAREEHEEGELVAW